MAAKQSPKTYGMDTNSTKAEFNNHSDQNHSRSNHNEPSHTHQEVRQRLETYRKTAEGGYLQKDADFMMRLSEKYQSKTEKQHINSFSQEMNLIGRTGRDTDRDVQHINDNNQKSMNSLRNKTMDEAKSYYHENYSVSKKFNKEKSVEKKPDIGRDK